MQLTLAVRGDLRPRVSSGGHSVTFVNDAGAAVVNYHGLAVHDAGGAALPAWFEASGEALVLSVADRCARYPLTIDPIAQQAYLKASNTDADDQFGTSVSISGDTVVVGAPFESSNATGVDGNQADNSAASAGAAYVFVRDAGGVWSQQAYLKASNTDANDWFGYSVTVSGATVVVVAPFERSSATGVNGNQADNSAVEAGAAYVFVRDAAGLWSQQAYLKASNTNAFDVFGASVAASGATVVVGASGEDSSATGVDGNQADNSAFRSGAAYVFVRAAGGVWSQQAYLKASNTDADDLFGISVTVSGDTVVVGAFSEDSSATGVNGNQADNSGFDSGAAYVFVRAAGGAWSQQAYLKASNTDNADVFGGSVAASGNTVVIGAYYEDSSATGVDGNQADNSASWSGAAYVFVRDAGGVWSQQAYLKASNTDSGDEFGWSVAVSGDTVVVGAVGEASSATGTGGNQADNNAYSAGAAYVFVRAAGGVWSQQAYLKASNTGAMDGFGASVAVSGDTVVVGAPYERSSATGVDGNQADNSAASAGAAYFFVCDTGGVWGEQAYLKASNTDRDDLFGSVAVSGDTVVVGAFFEDSSATGVNGNQADNSAMDSGAAYVFVRDAGGVWSQQAYLKASNTDGSDRFGLSVAVSGDTVVVGAQFEASNATGVNGNQGDNSASFSGAAYVFVRDAGGVWSQQAYLKASNTDGSDLFGLSVAVSGDTVVVGAPFEDSNATGVNGNQADNSAADAGAAYVFVRDAGGVWSQQAYLKASNTGLSDEFGGLVAVSGDTVVVGAFSEDSSATGVNGNQADNSAMDSGAAYVFVRAAGGAWSQEAYLKASNTDAGDNFGVSVAASGATVVVGAWQEASSATGVDGNQADNSAADAGAAYVFVRAAGGLWSQQTYLKASNTGGGDLFGIRVTASGNTVVVGARNEDSSATGVNGNQADNSAFDAGAAYVFVRDASGVWSQQTYLKASNTDAGDHFGFAALSGDTVVVGAPLEDSSATGVNGNQASNGTFEAGAAYVFVLLPDCNSNGIQDECDISCGTPAGLCDIPGCGTSADCNANGIPDECDIAAGTSQDSNANGIPDECELDCNNNGVPDSTDIANGTSTDCNADGIPDECEPGIPLDIPRFIGVLLGTNVNPVDACLADVNADGVLNGLDIHPFVAALLGP